MLLIELFQHKLQFQSAGWILQLHKECSQAQKSVLHIILHMYFNLQVIFSHKEDEHRPISTDLPRIEVYNKQQSYFETQDTTMNFFILKWTSSYWQRLVPHLLSVTLITIQSQEKNPFLYDTYTHIRNFSFREKNMWIMCRDMVWS